MNALSHATSRDLPSGLRPLSLIDPRAPCTSAHHFDRCSTNVRCNLDLSTWSVIGQSGPIRIVFNRMGPTAPIVVVDGTDGGHRRLRRRSMSEAAMAFFVVGGDGGGMEPTAPIVAVGDLNLSESHRHGADKR